MGKFPPSPPRGMCCCRAEGLDCVLNVLGIGPYIHDYVNEYFEPNYNKEADRSYCPICDKVVDRTYWDSWWNYWEGVIKKGYGLTCYAPASGGIGMDEGTYDDIVLAIDTNCGFYWSYVNATLFSQKCPHLAP
jgi:hypothetical protein